MAEADGIYFQIDPLSIKKLKYSFQALGTTAVNKILKEEASRAMKPILNTARANIPKRSGLLRKSLGIKVKAYANAVWGGMGVRHGFRGIITDPRSGGQIIADPLKYAHLVELGVRPHSVTRGARLPRAAAKAGTAAARDVPKGPAIHPGVQSSAFMQKAYEAHRASAVRAFADGAVKGIEAAWAEILVSKGAAV